MALLSESGQPTQLLPVACNLQSLNTLALECEASACVHLRDFSELPVLADLALHYSQLLVLGGGSNLVLPQRLPGLVARVGFSGIRLVHEDSECRVVEAAAGESWHGLVAYCVERGWGGLENLALIPGTVGAAPVQNIGAYGVEFSERFAGLRAYDLTRRLWVEFNAAQCRFDYRDSVFKHEPQRWVIASVRLRLPKAWKPVLEYPDLRRHPHLQGKLAAAQDIFEAVCEVRRSKLPDPAVFGNAGSFFKNPVVGKDQYDALLLQFPGLVAYAQADGRYKLAAGWLIDRCGWKGRRLGPVGMHERQALVLVNYGGATARDVLTLSAAVQADVLARYGVALELEPVLVQGEAA